MLSNGLTHLWTTPVMRYQLLKAGHVHLRSLEEAVLARYQAFSANCSARRPGETASDAWFAEQASRSTSASPSFPPSSLCLSFSVSPSLLPPSRSSAPLSLVL